VTFSFSRSLRLLKKPQYDYVFQSAKKIGMRSATLLYRLNNLEHPRLGLIVSKKTAKHANERNRFKRVSRESFRLMQKSLPNIDILSRGKIAESDNQALFSEFSDAWQKLIKIK
jgi:ribonuclease P protein component